MTVWFLIISAMAMPHAYPDQKSCERAKMEEVTMSELFSPQVANDQRFKDYRCVESGEGDPA